MHVYRHQPAGALSAAADFCGATGASAFSAFFGAGTGLGLQDVDKDVGYITASRLSDK